MPKLGRGLYRTHLQAHCALTCAASLFLYPERPLPTTAHHSSKPDLSEFLKALARATEQARVPFAIAPKGDKPHGSLAAQRAAVTGVLGE